MLHCSHRLDSTDKRLDDLDLKVTQATTWSTELWNNQKKLTDLEDRRGKNNIKIFGTSEAEYAKKLQTFLPGVTELTFTPPLEFQRVHQKASCTAPRPIIANILRFQHVRAILSEVRHHSPYTYKDHRVTISTDFSYETYVIWKKVLGLTPCSPEALFTFCLAGASVYDCHCKWLH
ncbi:hypothetical protein NDU88_004019 [Pleurodeles waltl]|uniref:Uncharacterized protein n=1 Tax=Pleurodeles waltl TaxID=8319 RepID=A0AAV7M8T0_PLEWA|nr:hypothetical protein NDU88_004019 [Pleurodeles waltl]